MAPGLNVAAIENMLRSLESVISLHPLRCGSFRVFGMLATEATTGFPVVFSHLELIPLLLNLKSSLVTLKSMIRSQRSVVAFDVL